MTHVQSLSQEVGSGDEGLVWFLFVIGGNGLLVAGRGAEQQESKPIHGIDLGTWLPKKLENLSAAPDELDHACRQSRDFASYFRVSYDIFLSIREAAKPVFSVCTHDRGCAY